MTLSISIFHTPEALAHCLAAELWGLSLGKKTAHIALSGGSTPQLLFDVLARDYAQAIRWQNLHFWWGDERCVLPTDPESNFGMTQAHLFDHIAIPEANIHRMRGEADPAAEAARYADEMDRFLRKANGMPSFDVVYLGMGTDGHTASIFPHNIELLHVAESCAVATHPQSGQQRVTLTGRAINNAEKVVFLVTGASKAEKIGEIFQQKAGYLQYPAAHIAPTHGQLTWLLDAPASVEI